MTRHRWIAGGAVLLAMLLWLGLKAQTGFAPGERPFRDLEAEDIVSASVELTPPDVTLAISDLEELTALLREAVCRERDDSYIEYAGQAVTFTLNLADGSSTRVMAYSPFLVIDGVGYRTDQAPCEALNAYANRLLEKRAEVILEAPPALAVMCGDTSLGAVQCGYAWKQLQPDGSLVVQLADSPHPLDLRAQLEVLETDGETAVLRFTQMPDALAEVRCWQIEDAPGDTGTLVSVRENQIVLEPGERIYQAEARWDGTQGGGTAWYAFAVRCGRE